jgi:two-component system response regulator FixJ
MSVGNPRVFIVDDDPAVRDSLVWLLSGEGFDTEPYANGGEFLENAEVLAGQCALVDLRMPEFDGFKLLKVIKDRFPKLPVILISGHGDIRIAVRAIKIGAWDFVEKPFNNKVILKTVRGAITESADGRHPARAAQKFKNAIMTLTPREKEVYDLVITGKTTPEIANILFICKRPVNRVGRG